MKGSSMQIQVIDNEHHIAFKPIDWRDLFIESNIEFETTCGTYTTTMKDIRANINDFTILEVNNVENIKINEHAYSTGYKVGYEECKKELVIEVNRKRAEKQETDDYQLGHLDGSHAAVMHYENKLGDLRRVYESEKKYDFAISNINIDEKVLNVHNKIIHKFWMAIKNVFAE